MARKLASFPPTMVKNPGAPSFSWSWMAWSRESASSSGPYAYSVGRTPAQARSTRACRTAGKVCSTACSRYSTSSDVTYRSSGSP